MCYSPCRKSGKNNSKKGTSKMKKLTHRHILFCVLYFFWWVEIFVKMYNFITGKKCTSFTSWNMQLRGIIIVITLIFSIILLYIIKNIFWQLIIATISALILLYYTRVTIDAFRQINKISKIL